jgi:peptide/nickel transport system substrate-binding protein
MQKRLWFSIAALAIGASLLVAASLAGAASSSTQKSTSGVAKKGGTMRVNLSDTDFDYFDPALSYTQWTWEFTYLTNLKLLNFPDKPAPEGAKLQPEAAAGMPAVSNGGKTYTFTIKSGFKFSPPSNQPVTAQSFADAINRDLNPAMQSPAVPFIKDVVGADAVVAGKAKTASGVKVSGNKLIITLVKPGADFLARISLPFFTAIPKGTPINPQGENTMAMAGPYYIKSYTRNRQAIIARNPNYHGSRPANIDQFVVTINTDLNQSFLQVKANQADWDAAALPPEQIASLAPLLKKQFFVNPEVETDYVALNNDSPLFKNLDARKAVNYAIDRPAMLRARGAFAGQRDDQILAPGMAGYIPQNIYPIKGADPAKGKAAYGKGGHVTLYAGNKGAAVVQSQVLQYNLKQIGMDVDVKQFTSAVLYAKAGTKGEPFDAVIAGWGWDYPDPFDFMDVLLNGNNIHATQNNNLAYFNDPTINKKLNQAASLTGDARYNAYGKLDIDITAHYAPWAAFLHRNRDEFFSNRIDPSCYVFQPIYSTVNLAALCLK